MNSNIKMKIAGFELGGRNTFIIAEISANHKQDFEIAVKTIKAIKESGANAVKLQTYTPDTITLNCDNEFFRIKHGTIWDGQTLYELYKEAYTPWEWQPKLKKIAEGMGLIFFSSPFDKTAVDFLESMDVPAYKVASLEITDIPLIKYIASKGKPVVLATGIATLNDIQKAVNACKEVGNNQIVILKCTTAYPAPIAESNLLTIPDIANRFNVIAGLSDHSLGIAVPVAAVALGAKVIEKHFILDKSLGGPDASFSLDKNEFKEMVDAVRVTEKAIGSVNYKLSAKIKKNREFSRSLFVVKDLQAGDILTEDNIKSIRPGCGLEPEFLPQILGKAINQDIKKGAPFRLDYLTTKLGN